MADWWASIFQTRALPDLILIAVLVLTALFWPRPKPKAHSPPCSCDGYNGVICRNHQTPKA